MFPQLAAAAAGLKTAAGGLKIVAACVAALLFTAAGATLGWSGAWLWAENRTIPSRVEAAEKAATEAADKRWQKKLDDAEEQARLETIAKQAEIDGAARAYLKQIGARDAAMTELEKQLASEREENAIPSPTPAPGGAGACRPALSRGVSQRLDGVGRSPAGDDPARADRALPSGRRPSGP